MINRDMIEAARAANLTLRPARVDRDGEIIVTVNPSRELIEMIAKVNASLAQRKIT